MLLCICYVCILIRHCVRIILYVVVLCLYHVLVINRSLLFVVSVRCVLFFGPRTFRLYYIVLSYYMLVCVFIMYVSCHVIWLCHVYIVLYCSTAYNLYRSTVYKLYCSIVYKLYVSKCIHYLIAMIILMILIMILPIIRILSLSLPYVIIAMTGTWVRAYELYHIILHDILEYNIIYITYYDILVCVHIYLSIYIYIYMCCICNIVLWCEWGPRQSCSGNCSSSPRRLLSHYYHY